MKKIKYFYNANTLRYEKLETPLRVKLLRLLGFLSAAFVTAIILVSLAYKYFPSVNEKRLMQNNESLRYNYDVLSDRVKKLQDEVGDLEKRDNHVYREIFEANPIPDSARAKALQHQEEIKLVESMDQDNLSLSIANTLNNLSSRIAYQTKSYNEIDGFVKNKEQLLVSTPAIQPVSNK